MDSRVHPNTYNHLYLDNIVKCEIVCKYIYTRFNHNSHIPLQSFTGEMRILLKHQPSNFERM